MHHLVKMFRKIVILVLKILNFSGKIIFPTQHPYSLVLGMPDKMLHHIIRKIEVTRGIISKEGFNIGN